MTVSTKWTSHLKTAEQKREFSIDIQESKLVLARLGVLIEKDVSALDAELDGNEMYELPGASERTAHKLGQRKALKKILKLIQL